MNEISKKIVLVGIFSVLCSPILKAQDKERQKKEDIAQQEEIEYIKQEVSEFKEIYKYEQKAQEIPAFFTIITEEEIKRYGYRNLMDIFRVVSGTYVSYDRTYGTVGMRGFNRAGDFNSRILILLNGHIVNDVLFGSFLVDNGFLVDPEIIERIEIAKGPGNMYYGFNAIFAVINIVTKKGTQIEGMNLSVEKQSFRKMKGFITGGKGSEKWDIILSGSYLDSDGPSEFYFPEYKNQGGITKDNGGEEVIKAFGQARYGDFKIQGGVSSRSKQIPTASYYTVFGSKDEIIKDVNSFAELKFSKKVSKEINFFAKAYLNHSDETGNYPSINKDIGYYLNIDNTSANVVGTELRIDQKILKNNRLFLGVELMRTWMEYTNFDDVSGMGCVVKDSPVPCSDLSNEYTSFSIFGMDEFRLLDNLVLTFRLRYDNYGSAFRDFQSITLPSLSLVWLINDLTSLKFSYCEAFRAPSLYEAFFDDGAISMKANPDLKPERIKSYEGIFEKKLLDDISLKIGIFYYDITDLIDQNRTSGLFGEIIQYQNINNATIDGIEMELGGFINNFIHASFSWTLHEARYSDGSRLPNSPLHNAKFRFSMPLYMNKIFGGAEFIYLGSRETVGEQYLDSYFLTNITLSARNIFNTLELSVSAYNLLDVTYYDAVSLDQYPIDKILQDGIAFRFQASYTF